MIKNNEELEYSSGKLSKLERNYLDKLIKD